MIRLAWLLVGCVVALVCGCQQPNFQGVSEPGSAPHRGLHLLVENDARLIALQAELPRLAAAGVNALIVEVGYNFQFRSHPELAAPAGTTAQHAHAFAVAARRLGIRIIPELDCLGHQSWSKTTFALLRQHPEFDETPGRHPDNEGIYCRSWCPQHPEVNRVVFALIDELLDAFEANAFHVGMDEVFLLASEHCPRCRGGDPAALFARAVNDLHRHLVGERKVEMLMWGDRLLEARAMQGGEWEYSKNGTAGAVALIPRDIVICDWHYENQRDYPSIDFLLRQGFRVWPATWQPLDAAQAFSTFCHARRTTDARVLGILVTVWNKTPLEKIVEWPPFTAIISTWQ